MRKGEYADVPPGVLLAIRRRQKLSQVELAALAGSSIFKAKQGYLYARRVQAWEKGESRIPLANWDLLQVRLHLLREGLATLEELCTIPLVRLVQRSTSNKDMTVGPVDVQSYVTFGKEFSGQ